MRDLRAERVIAQHRFELLHRRVPVYAETPDQIVGVVDVKQFLLDRPAYPQAVMLLVQAYRGAGRPEATQLIERVLDVAADAMAWALVMAGGLLIGADVRIGLTWPVAARIGVIGRPELTRLYAAALAEANREAIELDGEQCFLAGIQEIAKRI